MTYRLVVFDFDGTLADSLGQLVAVYNRLAPGLAALDPPAPKAAAALDPPGTKEPVSGGAAAASASGADAAAVADAPDAQIVVRYLQVHL